MKVDRLLLSAAVLALLTALVHIFVGTGEIVGPLSANDFPKDVGHLLLACWHLVSVALLVSGMALGWSALPKNRMQAGPLPLFIAVLWNLFALVFVVIGLDFKGWSGLILLPQWFLLFPVGILAGLSCWRTTSDQ